MNRGIGRGGAYPRPGWASLLPANVGRLLVICDGDATPGLALKKTGRAAEIVIVSTSGGDRAGEVDRHFVGRPDVPGQISAILRSCGTFDTILSLDVLGRSSNPAWALANLVRSLRPGGIFILCLPNPEHVPMVLRGRDLAAVARASACGLTRSSMIELVTGAGLVVERALPMLARRRHRLLNFLSGKSFERFFASQYALRVHKPATLYSALG